MENVEFILGEDNCLYIKIDPTQRQGVSSTGKSQIVASTRGTVDAGQVLGDASLARIGVSLNVYAPNGGETGKGKRKGNAPGPQAIVGKTAQTATPADAAPAAPAAPADDAMSKLLAMVGGMAETVNGLSTRIAAVERTASVDKLAPAPREPNPSPKLPPVQATAPATPPAAPAEAPKPRRIPRASK